MVSGSAPLPDPGNGGLSERSRLETAACAYAATVRKRRGVMAPAAELPNIKTGLAEDSTSRCKFDYFRSVELSIVDFRNAESLRDIGRSKKSGLLIMSWLCRRGLRGSLWQ
jgi:hypothetical protein